MTNNERQAAEQLCGRLDEKLLALGEFIHHERTAKFKDHTSTYTRQILDLDESRLVIRRLLAETDDD